MKLIVRLYGPFMAMWSDKRPCRIVGVKQQALLALLATAPEFARTRSWLISRLWSENDEAQGRRNLRQALYALRAVLGDRCDALIGTDGDLVYLNVQHVLVNGSPADGDFLEGFDLCEEGFEDWLRDQRQTQEVSPPSSATEPQRVRHRIAVLPFAPGDSDCPQGIGDAIAHQLTVAFARSGMVDAISHLSCREMRGVACPVETDYHLVGRCYGGSNAAKIDVTLIDAKSGTVLWGERFDTGPADVLAGECGLVDQIAGQCLWLIVSQSCQMSSVRPLASTAAHVLMMNGIAEMHSFDRDRFMTARTMLDEVASRCADHALPLAWLAQWHLLSVYQGWSSDPTVARTEAGDAVARALDLNPYCEVSLAIDGNLYNVMDGDFATAEQRFTAARAINPSSAMVSQLAAVLYCFTGRGAEAVKMTERARRLTPRDPRRAFFTGIGASSYLVAGQWDEAVAEAEAALVLNPGHLSARRCRVIGLQRGGRRKEAAAAAQDLMACYPDLTVAAYRRAHPARDTSVGIDWANALGDAGIPMN
ncbi:MAG: tetratricopeptide repeat protein [Pseudomonadota bacterium]